LAGTRRVSYEMCLVLVMMVTPPPGPGGEDRPKEHAQEQGRARGGTGEPRLDGGRDNARAAAGPRTCAP